MSAVNAVLYPLGQLWMGRECVGGLCVYGQLRAHARQSINVTLRSHLTV